MKIWYVTGEAAPYATSGGLGDVMGSLPQAVKAASPEAEVAVIMPLYSRIGQEHRAKMEKLTEFYFSYGWRQSYCGIYRLLDGEVAYYFIDNEQYFKRGGLYGEFDDGERYAFFCHAVIEFMLHKDMIPDILHANDWQSALVIVYLKLRYAMCQKLSHIKTLFTIHNIEYQGQYSMESLGSIFDIGREGASVMEYNGAINLLKAAVVLADRVNTVSPNYARELHEPYFAYGMAPIIHMFSDKISGIINGLDVACFDPARSDIPTPFSVDSAEEGKNANKHHLQARLGLPQTAVPLVAMVSRLTEGKGIDLVLHVFDEMIQQGVQFVLLGTGDERYESILSFLCSRYPTQARAILEYDRALSKEIYAAADIFLMPSKTEPCGLSQMIACRYGAVPVVHGVGGLADSIIPYGEPCSCGFVFRNYNAHDMLFRVKDALTLYQDKPSWHAFVRRAMTADFTWQTSAEKYLALYQQLL